MSARLRKLGGGWWTLWMKRRGLLIKEVGVAVAAQESVLLKWPLYQTLGFLDNVNQPTTLVFTHYFCRLGIHCRIEMFCIKLAHTYTSIIFHICTLNLNIWFSATRRCSSLGVHAAGSPQPESVTSRDHRLALFLRQTHSAVTKQISFRFQLSCMRWALSLDHGMVEILCMLQKLSGYQKIFLACVINKLTIWTC